VPPVTGVPFTVTVAPLLLYVKLYVPAVASHDTAPDTVKIGFTQSGQSAGAVTVTVCAAQPDNIAVKVISVWFGMPVTVPDALSTVPAVLVTVTPGEDAKVTWYVPDGSPSHTAPATEITGLEHGSKQSSGDVAANLTIHAPVPAIMATSLPMFAVTVPLPLSIPLITVIGVPIGDTLYATVYVVAFNPSHTAFPNVSAGNTHPVGHVVGPVTIITV
jgi:hypothetical protein